MDNVSANDDVRRNAKDALHKTSQWRTLSSNTSVFERCSLENSEEPNDNGHVRTQFWSSSFQGQRSEASRQETASFEESVNGGAPNEGDDTVVSADQERQLLLLMLLAQVCALHDPTPRTFTVHVLELFERGILDRESIRFLFDLGLVPAAGSPSNLLSLEPTNQAVSIDVNDDQVPATSIQKWSRDIMPIHPALERAREASAIRIHLQRHESREKKSKKKGRPTAQPSDPATLGKSWKVENHPLYLSRYQREFTQIGLLAGGSFGQVFQATSKVDGRDYAIKRVAFSATGYSNESVTQVIREVRCLAHCDHPNCVRYYTSWLEPSWMTGSGTAVAPDQLASKQVQRKLLTDLNHLVISGESGKGSFSQSEKSISLDRDKYSYEPTQSSFRHRRRFSFGSSLDDSVENSKSDIWSKSGLDDNQPNLWSKSGISQDDSFLPWGRSESAGAHKARTNGSRKQNPPQKTYRYQINLFIQMQLCLPMTLADWIRQRNQSCASQDNAARIGPAMDIVMQLVRGLAHVHAKDIIHRDLKPGNIFTSTDGNFRIGDFGLSKLIRSANGEEAWDAGASVQKLLLPAASNLKGQGEKMSSWAEPLTAGVGTASYAAPEQVASDRYGSEADIFSLGLIMLELVCCFDTEHERVQTFQDCRRGKLPGWLVSEYPSLASLIQRCTDKQPQNRPSAEALLCSSDLLHATASAESQETLDHLRGQLKEKEEKLEQQKNVIAEKDKIIEELQRKMDKLNGTNYEAAIVQASSATGNEDLAVVVDASYSSDDDY